MDKDWAADVKKFVPDADDGVIAGIVRYCGIALQKADSSLVSYTDPAELGRVRENFLKKKLGLMQSDEELDGAIAKVGERLKGVNFKNRVTVYYMLLEHFGLLHLFAKAGTAAATPIAADKSGALGLAAGAGAAIAAGAATSVDAAKGIADSVGDTISVGADTMKSAFEKTPNVAPVMSSPISHEVADDEPKGVLGWLWWLILGALLLGLLWWFFLRPVPVAPPAPTDLATDVSAPATTDENVAAAIATAPETVAVPDGAGVTSEVLDGKPVVKIYFDTAKAEVVPAFGPAALALKTYLDAHPGSGIGVSGFNDPTGNATANAALSKKRAEAVKAALVAASVPDAAIALVKPEAVTDTTATKAEARRVEVFIK